MATNGFNKQAAIQRLGEKGEMTVAALHVSEVLIFAAQLPAAQNPDVGIRIIRGKRGPQSKEGQDGVEVAHFFNEKAKPLHTEAPRVFLGNSTDYMKSPVCVGPFYLVLGDQKITKDFLGGGGAEQRHNSAKGKAKILGVIVPSSKP